MATGDTAVSVLLAEYNALRGEIDRRSQAQQTLANLALGLSGALVAYAVAHDAVVVLLLQPILASTLGLLYADHGLAIRRASRYLDRCVVVSIERLTREPALMRWERIVQSPRNWVWRVFWLLPPALLFIASSAVVLTVALGARAFHDFARDSQLLSVPLWSVALLWIVGFVLTVLATIGFIVAYRPSALSGFDEALDAGERDGQPGRAV